MPISSTRNLCAFCYRDLPPREPGTRGRPRTMHPACAAEKRRRDTIDSRFRALREAQAGVATRSSATFPTVDAVVDGEGWQVERGRDSALRELHAFERDRAAQRARATRARQGGVAEDDVLGFETVDDERLRSTWTRILEAHADDPAAARRAWERAFPGD